MRIVNDQLIKPAAIGQSVFSVENIFANCSTDSLESLLEPQMSLIQSDKKRVIVGLGATGKSCMRHFLRLGLPFTVLDTRAEPPGIKDIAREFPDVDIRLGETSAELLADANELYISPGIAVDDGLFASAIENGALISGDIDLFAQQASAPVIAISGSNAKSTVTTLVGLMAQCDQLNVAVGGNLGEPALDLLAPQRDCYVLELSSFQLERCSDLKAKVACILNISADHMDRHQTMMVYHQAKQRVYRGAEHIVFNRNDHLTAPLQTTNVSIKSFALDSPDLGQFGIRELNGQRYIVKGFDPLIALADIPLAGDHNLLNVLAAVAIGDAAGFSLAAMQSAIKDFNGLPHRCELVADINGVQFINDSKATNVGATLAALQGFAASVAGSIVLIAGGQTKGADFSKLITALDTLACQLILLGEGAAEIAALVGDKHPLYQVSDLEAAVVLAADISQPGDMVLLSPACASFDMFDGFEHRGDVFKSAVNALVEVLQ